MKYQIINNKSHVLIVFTLIFLVYLWSLPRTVVLEDDGYFILASYFNGIAHPPGYPLFTFLGHLSTYLPLGSVAFRVHILNALIGALCCVCLWSVSNHLLKDKQIAVVVALVFGFSQVFWSQTIIAEVYSLNVLLFLILLLLSLRYVNKNSPTHRLPCLMGFVYGLGLSNHWPLLVLATPLLLCILWPRRHFIIYSLPKSLVCFSLGLLPYAWMVWRSQMQPEFSFYGSINNLSEFWFYVSREGYAEIDKSPTADWWDRGQFCLYVLRETATQFGPLGVIFVLLGLISQWRHWSKQISVGLLLGYLCSTFVLIVLLRFDYDVFHQAIFRVYPLIAYVICSLWLGLGLLVIKQYLVNRVEKSHRNLIMIGVMFVVIATTWITSAGYNYRANDSWAENYAKNILDSVEENAILFVYGDTDTGSIAYVNKILQHRDDITLYSAKGQAFPNRLFRSFELTIDQLKKRISEFILTTDRPVYYTNQLDHDFGTENYGILKKVIKDKSNKFQRVKLNDDTNKYIEDVISMPKPLNKWNYLHRRLLLTEYCIVSLNIREHAVIDENNENIDHWIDNTCNTFQGKIEQIRMLLHDGHSDRNLLTQLINEAELLKHQAVLKSELLLFEKYKTDLLNNYK